MPYDVARKLFTGVGLEYRRLYLYTILKKTGQTMTMLDHMHREKDIRTKNTIDILHKALQTVARPKMTEEADELLVSTGNQGNDKFNQTMQAIIEAGAAKPGAHPETAREARPRGVQV